MPKILVIDDDPDFIKIARTILLSQNLEVLTAGNGEQGLEVMRKEKPDLVLLDIMMSYILDGLDARRRMAEDKDLKDIPVIMVTSLTGERVRSELPSDEYVPSSEWLHKPIDPDNLLKLVRKYLGWHPVAETDKQL
jgi:CheY-like chemotaxis protein